MNYIGRDRGDANLMNFLIETSKNDLWKQTLRLEEKQRRLISELSRLKALGAGPEEIAAKEEEISGCNYKETIVKDVRSEIELQELEFGKIVSERFIDEYDRAEALQRHPPDESNYAYTDKNTGAKVVPFLMQARTACLTTEQIRCGKCTPCQTTNGCNQCEAPQFRLGAGNWCTPGSGKTLAAIYASRHMNARTTVVVCPASVVPMWAGSSVRGVYNPGEIQKAYPHAEVKVVASTKDLSNVHQGG